MTSFNREKIQKRNHNRFRRRNISDDLKKKENNFSRKNTIILISRIFISVFVTSFNFYVNLN